MKVQWIEREINEIVNIGNYESVRPSIRIRAALEEGEDPEIAYHQLSEVARDLFEKAIKEDVEKAMERRGM